MVARLDLVVTAQALADALRAELGLPLVLSPDEDAFDVYASALTHISRHPELMKKFQNQTTRLEWLRAIESAIDGGSNGGTRIPERGSDTRGHVTRNEDR